MSFKTFDEISPRNQGSGNFSCIRTSCGVGRYKNQGAIIIPSAVASKMGWLVGDRVDVLVGEGSDAGLIGLRRNNTGGGFKLVRHGNSKNVQSLGIKSPRIFRGKERTPTIDVGHWVEGDTVLIDLPDDFRKVA